MGTIARLRAPATRAARRDHVGAAGMNTDLVLVFDVETNTDFRQRARIGGYQIKHLPSQTVRAAGFFYDDLTSAEIDTARAYVAGFADRLGALVASDPHGAAAAPAWGPLARFVREAGGVPLLSKAAFVDLLYAHYRAGGALAGHNIPFDIGALCTDWRGYDDKRGRGFIMSLCDCADRTSQPVLAGRNHDTTEHHVRCARHPNIVTMNVGGKKTRFMLEGDEPCGPAVDTLVLGRALGGPGNLSLAGMGTTFACRICKRAVDDDEHGAALDFTYLDYLACDVAASMELLERQFANYAAYGLTTPVCHILSEASVGKAIYKDIGVTPGISGRAFYHERTGERVADTAVRAIMDKIRPAYAGARSEVRLRLQPVPVFVHDFLSQYPTVNLLLDLQSLLIADEYEIWMNAAITRKAQSVLTRATLSWLQDQSHWLYLRTIVRIDPTGCLLPMKWQAGPQSNPFGLATAASFPGPRWMPLADVIACTLLTGHAPEILDALWFEPRGTLATNVHMLFGKTPVDVQTEDFFKSVIVKRTEVKALIKTLDANDPEHTVQSAFQKCLKLVANATSYGILAETVVRGRAEEQGVYYAPFIACHITAAGRLLLAIAECVARDIGMRRWGKPIRYVMCDTDGVAFAQPDGVDDADFNAASAELSDWFRVLSPYPNASNLFAREKDQWGKLWFFGVSCKRYCLYTRDESAGEIVIRKLSAHGTGDKLYDGDAERFAEDEQDDELAPISVARKGAGAAWARVMWTRALQRAHGSRAVGTDERKLPAGFPPEPWNGCVTRSQVRISTPFVAAQYRGKIDVRPYSFFLRIAARDKSKLRMAAHFRRTETALLAGEVVDLETGRLVDAVTVRRNAKTLHDALREYFAHAETKSVGETRDGYQQAGWLDRPVIHVGKIENVNRKGQSLAQAELFEDTDDAA